MIVNSLNLRVNVFDPTPKQQIIVDDLMHELTNLAASQDRDVHRMATKLRALGTLEPLLQNNIEMTLNVAQLADQIDFEVTIHNGATA